MFTVQKANLYAKECKHCYVTSHVAPLLSQALILTFLSRVAISLTFNFEFVFVFEYAVFARTVPSKILFFRHDVGQASLLQCRSETSEGVDS